MKKTIIICIIVLSFLGLIDSSYLTTKHFEGGSVTCSIGGTEIGNCKSVLESSYATVGVVPVALIGVAYYFTLFVLSAFLLSGENKKLERVLLGISALGLLASLWFVYLQLFVLDAICMYCFASALITLLLFITLSLLFRSGGKEYSFEKSDQEVVQ